MTIKPQGSPEPAPDIVTQPHPVPRPAGEVPTSPYGPHHGRVDEAAGGADSSPHETEPSGERKPDPPPKP